MKHFFDVGANTGQTFDFLTYHPEYDGYRVWCFEPSPRVYADLVMSAEALRSKNRWNGITTWPIGLLGSTRNATFFMMKTGSTADSFEPSMGEPESSTEVQGVDIVDFIEKKIGRDDEIVLKLDCEGSEYEILERLLEVPEVLQNIRKVLVEFHQVDHSSYPREQKIRNAYAARGIPVEPWLL